MEKINLVIDGNYFFFKTIGVFSGYSKKGPQILSDQSEIDMFVGKIVQDLASAISKIPHPKRVIFCRDSASWRKKYMKTRKEYKGDREKNETINWENFYQTMEKFGTHLEKECGFIYSSVYGTEGDDLIMSWSKALNEQGENVIILSGDKDCCQLVETVGDAWTIQWNGVAKNSKLYVPFDMDFSAKKEIDIFSFNPVSEREETKISKLIDISEVEKISVKEFIFKKILTGDKGDSVPSSWIVSRGGKNYSITEKMSTAIWQAYLQTAWSILEIGDLVTNKEFIDWVAGVSIRSLQDADTQENRGKFSEYYKENAALVWVSYQSIPLEIGDSIKTHLSHKFSQTASGIKWSKEAILENSEWKQTDRNPAVPRKFDPFS
jgi:5'-3' exonuclease